MVVPLLLDIPSQGTESVNGGDFFVRLPGLEPRRPEVPPLGGVANASRFNDAQGLENPACLSQIQRNKNKYLNTKKAQTSKIFQETTRVSHNVSVSVLGDEEGLGKVPDKSGLSWGLAKVY